MVLSVLVAIVSAPALLGTQEAIRQSQSKEKREEHRARRCNLIASCIKSSKRSREINGRPIVLRDGKLWIDTGTSDGSAFGHPYAGYYLPYPDSKYEGLVTTITDVAPIMNWVYVDKDTYEVKYGVRLDAQPNLTGPFDCTRQDRRMTFDGWEGWCAVEEYPSLWALYFDKDDNGLQGKIQEGTRVLEVELTRKEKKWKKDGEERQQDQTTKRAVETKENTPVDNPITSQPELSPPGVGVPNEEKAPEPLKPFGLPKSIFSDPPRPLFFGQELLPPRSPPPAYSQQQDTAPVTAEVVMPPEPETLVSQPQIEGQAIPLRPKTPPPASQRPIQEDDFLRSRFETPRQAPTPPSKKVPEPTPTVPAPLKITPPAEKRRTPKLNRMSGTRAMSQAQMFEALATGQAPTNEPASRMSNSGPPSTKRPFSEYSDTPIPDELEVLQMYEELRASMPPLDMLPGAETQRVKASAPLKMSDPAVFARPSSGSSTTSDPAIVKDKISGASNQRKDSSKTLQVSEPKKTSPLLPAGVFRGDSKRGPSPHGGAATSTSASRRQPLPAQRDRTGSLERASRPSPSSSRESPGYSRNALRPSGSREPPLSRDRTGSTSSRGGDSSRSSPAPRPRMETVPRGERPSPRPSAARANTTPAREGVQRSRTTTSTLIREIDDLVGTGRDRSGSTASNTSTVRRNDSRDEARGLPLRRTLTARDPRRNEGPGTRPDRTRELGSRPLRRGELDPERRN